ncbi:hypothetical protein DL98DRAFT_472569 [Cadophora sp. DSE1049]|nr:hypothetical protein DL98DRAFT_472569 [Cadophora sp. DSE1049]
MSRVGSTLPVLWSPSAAAAKFLDGTDTPGCPIAATSRPGEIPRSRAIPLKLAKDQCPICIGDEWKSYKERMGSFCRPAKIIDHVKRIHLKRRDPHAKIKCYHLTCKS